MNHLFETGFHIKAKNGTEIHLPINAKVTVLRGDSATGKTKMLKWLEGTITTHEISEITFDKKR